MYEVEFYEDNKGNCEVADYLNKLSKKERKKVVFNIQRLETSGTWLGEPLVSWLVKGKEPLWELRIDKKRFPFFVHGRKIIIVSVFIKKTKKTPIREIEKAKRCKKDWLDRNK